MPRTSPARQRILDTAHTLFYRDGYRATGVDRIIAESGVAKMTFYRHFPSKAKLIDAFFDMRHARWMHWFESRLQALDAPHRGLAVIADALGEWFRQTDFRGCAFINALAEDGVQVHMRTHVQAHKAQLKAVLCRLAGQRQLAAPEAVAEAAMVVIEGCIVRAQTHGDAEAAVAAGKQLLAALENSAPPPQASA